MASKGRTAGDDTGYGCPEGKYSTASCARAAGSLEARLGRGVKQSLGDRQWGVKDLLSRIAEVITWKRPMRSTSFFIAANSIFWFVALGSWRVYHLLALGLIILVMFQMIRDIAIFRQRGPHLLCGMSESWEVIDSSHENRAGASQFTDSWMSCKLVLQEMSSFKQQNPGKFCLLSCGLCMFFAVLGRYIPGIIISYIAVLAVFLWPLLSSHEFGLWVEPVLQKLDFGVGDFLQRIKENHEKRILQRQEERSEADQSAFFPKLDSSVCQELSMLDADVSLTTWTENDTFDLPVEHTPETDDSEDLDLPNDQEEPFRGAYPDFPSVDSGTGTNGEEDDSSLDLPAPPPPRPSGSSSPEQEAPRCAAMELVDRMAGDVIAAAVSAAIQEQLEARPPSPRTTPTQQPQDFTKDSDSEAEDFELLDQSELEQLEGELGLERAAQQASPKPSKPSFFSRLLGRH
ncbi:hypothetical protein AGOR_G00040720 [Albula goreensis]|uniref:RETREG1-3/ARL6IP-like N-terminal reticulon-homology domain-containing protein n=1 Tax=Albula goreensis TaxID=1534307 RepID=A0A8T3DXH6_9TELE|nr:hypothetical protein AGOR_G00040720 [Albula goreensis]